MTLQVSPQLDVLPDVGLASRGTIAGALRTCGFGDLRAAVDFVWKLPYGRNRHPEDPLCVLTEARGTCSTKHALLARLLEEEGIGGFELRLGIYEMMEAN